MATKNIERRTSDTTNCPRCGGEAVIINSGKMVKWLTCTKCKFKMVLENVQEDIKITPFNTEEDTKKIIKL